MKLSLSSLVLLVILGVAISQQIQRDYVPEVVYPNKANRLRSRVNTGSVEQKQTSARRNQLDDRQHNLLQKRLEHIKENRRNRDQFIVVAPVEGHRVYTKDRYSVPKTVCSKVDRPLNVPPFVFNQENLENRKQLEESNLRRDGINPTTSPKALECPDKPIGSAFLPTNSVSRRSRGKFLRISPPNWTGGPFFSLRLFRAKNAN
ncbi:hypothetical protein L596_002824 [Steinernema carpocapsae]|uniref:Uncharacterized protein n=1 Tax=Steinernema carpocapsae TaxID=34508 RepID=A0A4V6I7T0_STECR|nr:hypothetical protein L596_002824 [Steinernema carpocapsae]